MLSVHGCDKMSTAHVKLDERKQKRCMYIKYMLTVEANKVVIHEDAS